MIRKATTRPLLTVWYLNKKNLTSQPEAFSDEGFHRTAAPVGSLAVFYFGTERGGGAVKNITLYFARGWSLSLQKRCNLKEGTSNGLVLGLNLGAMNT